MAIMGTGQKVEGIKIVTPKCPKCGGPMFRITCKCPFRRRGWALCAKCLNPACAHTMGLVKVCRGQRHLRY